jgi:hypothetical protein
VLVPPIVVGSPGSADAEKARRLAELRATGEAREVIFGFKPADGSDAIEVIVTGVARKGRDDGVDIPATEPPKEYDAESARRYRDAKASCRITPKQSAAVRRE